MKYIVLFLSLLTAYAGFSKNSTWSVINEKGETEFSLDASFVYPFNNGVAKVYKSMFIHSQWMKAYGYVDKTGKNIIPFAFDQAQDFVAEVTWVRKIGELKYTLIDKEGNEIPTKKYNRVGTFSGEQNDLCAVFSGEKMGFVNTKGEEVIPCIYKGAQTFQDGLVSVMLADDPAYQYGFIDKAGEVVIPLEYKNTGMRLFNDNMAIVVVKGKTIIIDRDGKKVFKTRKGKMHSVGYGLVSVITKPDSKGWGWVDMKNKYVIEPIYDYATPFNEDGYAIVEKNGLKGLIDTTGKELLSCVYDMVYGNPTEDGFLLGVYPGKATTALVDAKKDYFDANFNKIVFKNAKQVNGANGSDLMSFTGVDNLMGFMNRSYEVIIPATYKKVYPFNEGLAWVRN